MKFEHQKLYINGELVEAEDNKKYDIICPADEIVVATIA